METTANLPQGQTVQCSEKKINVKIHESKLRKRLNKYSLFGRVSSRKLRLTINNMAAQLQFAKLHPNKPQDFWDNVLYRRDQSGDVWP